jgi:hypothetical protein
MLEFDAYLGGRVGLCLVGIAVVLPGCDFVDENDGLGVCEVEIGQVFQDVSVSTAV